MGLIRCYVLRKQLSIKRVSDSLNAYLKSFRSTLGGIIEDSNATLSRQIISTGDSNRKEQVLLRSLAGSGDRGLYRAITR